jgi:hypothetical protein
MAGLCWAGGLALCLGHGLLWMPLAAGLGLALLFVASPGLSAWLAGAARLSARSLALGLLGAALALAPLALAEGRPLLLWGLQLAACGLLVLLAALARKRLGAFHPATLGLGSLVLSLPALHLASIIQGPSRAALAFWVWPAAFLPCAALGVQDCLRGRGFRPWPWLGAALLAGLAWRLASPIPALLLAAWALRFGLFAWRKQRPKGPMILRLGWEQAAWCLALAALWALAALRR